MASIRQSNHRAKNLLGDEKHFAHAMRSNVIQNVVNRYDLWRLPVCENCERMACWHKGYTAHCFHCGHTTKKPITLEQYYAGSYHVDRTMNRDADYIIGRQKGQHVATIWGGEAGLADEDKRVLVIARR